MSHQHTDAEPCRILIVEDDEIDRQSVVNTIEHKSNQYVSHSVDCIRGATSALQENDFDIIISDMNLPDSTGIETINQLLSISGKTPLVVLSGDDNDNIALQAVNAGAQDYISKRYIHDASLLTRTLRHAIERHQMKLKLEMTRDRAKYLAQYDQCTSLPNRLLFLDRLQQAVMLSKRQNDNFTLCFVDLDRFKTINDAFGHDAGDEVLRCVAKRMTNCLRNCDTVARYGGDEFALLLHNVDNEQEIQTLVTELIAQINKPIHISNRQCSVGASVGITCYPHHGLTSDTLLKHADMAMYDAKQSGRNMLRFFSHELFKKTAARYTLEEALVLAITSPDEQFELIYQPLIDIHTNKAFSVETLIRWRHPELGLILPNDFIPLAEEIGLIEKIDEWVFGQTCKQLAKSKASAKALCIALNISSQSFNRQDFVSTVIEPNLRHYDIDGDQIEIEITERLILEDNKFVLDQMHALKELNIHIAIDDFGTGFSSLSYLNRYPIDTIKIDGSFICDDSSEQKNQDLLKAIVALGMAMKLRLVAECIETEEQRQHIEDLGCRFGQGFLWGKPGQHWIEQV